MQSLYNKKQLISIVLHLRQRNPFYTYKKKITLFFGLITYRKEGFYNEWLTQPGPFSEEEMKRRGCRVIENEAFYLPHIIFNFSDESSERKIFLTEQEAQEYYDVFKRDNDLFKI